MHNTCPGSNRLCCAQCLFKIDHVRMRAGRRKVENTKCDFLRVFAWRPAMRKCENAIMKDKITTLKTWRVFVWRPFAPPGENTTDGRRQLATYKCVVSLPGGAKSRHAKTRHMVTFSCFRVATFRPARQRYDKQEAKRRNMKTVVLSCGGAKGRHAIKEKVTIWRVFVWRPFAFSPRKHVYTTWHKSATICFRCSVCFLQAILSWCP